MVLNLYACLIFNKITNIKFKTKQKVLIRRKLDVKADEWRSSNPQIFEKVKADKIEILVLAVIGRTEESCQFKQTSSNLICY